MTIAQTIADEVAKARADAPAPPLMFRCERGAMVARYPGQLAKHYREGEAYALVEYQHRSSKTHNHEFAFLNEAWETLPESLAQEYPNAEVFRKKLLIQTGQFHERIIDAGSHAAALRVAAYLRGEDVEGFDYIAVRGVFVIVRKAISQSKRSMDRKQFQESKQKLIDACADLLGVTPEALTKQAVVA